jgi:hypothetical protein
LTGYDLTIEDLKQSRGFRPAKDGIDDGDLATIALGSDLRAGAPERMKARQFDSLRASFGSRMSDVPDTFAPAGQASRRGGYPARKLAQREPDATVAAHRGADTLAWTGTASRLTSSRSSALSDCRLAFQKESFDIAAPRSENVTASASYSNA